MLQIVIPDAEYYDERKNLFVTRKGASLNMEHSLLSVSKWESIHHKPFLSDTVKTLPETLDYYRCMTITKNVDPAVYNNMTVNIQKQIQDYIDDSMTATWFNETMSNRGDRFNGEIVTSEIIYYWMVSLNIPFECQKWHLNRLITLIRTISAKNAPKKKVPKRQMMLRNAELNAQRRAKLNSKG